MGTQTDSTLERLEANAAFARQFAQDTQRDIGGLAARIADEEAEHADALVARHKRLMAEADARGWK